MEIKTTKQAILTCLFLQLAIIFGSVCVKCWSSVTICFYVRASNRECWELLGSLPIPTLNADRALFFLRQSMQGPQINGVCISMARRRMMVFLSLK
jgi:hypothetical protein